MEPRIDTRTIADNKKTNIEKYLLSNQTKINPLGASGSFGSTGFGSPSNIFRRVKNINARALGTGIGVKMFGITSDINGSAIARILTYIASVIIVIFIILLFVHFFIKPIFILHPGSPGIIPIPGFDDGILYWDKLDPDKILNKDLPINSIFFNYSLTLDMFIHNPFNFSTNYRILFSRGATLQESPTSDSMKGMLSNYNLAVALLPDTNDMIVSVLNTNNDTEDIKINNIPIQEPFKLGIVFLERALEVYLNGRLMKTHIFKDSPKGNMGDIDPAKDTSIVKLRNLKIWPRILTAAEIRYSKPPLSSAKDFAASEIPTSSTCSISSNEA